MKIKLNLVAIILSTTFTSQSITPIFAEFTDDVMLINTDENTQVNDHQIEEINLEFLTPIEGLEDVYILGINGTLVTIVDQYQNKLIEKSFREVSAELSENNTLLVKYAVGMGDYSLGILDENLNIILSNNYHYTSYEFLELDDKSYIKAKALYEDDFHYYDLNGNKFDSEPQSIEDFNFNSEFNSEETESEESFDNLTPIEGLEDVYILGINGTLVTIVDQYQNKLIEKSFREVSTELSENNTLLVKYAVGMSDFSFGILDENLNIIVPNDYHYISYHFLEVDDNIYIKLQALYEDDFHYYDLNGTKLDEEPLNYKPLIDLSDDISYSSWAKDSIIEAVELNLVPENILSNYTDKITRQEFCQIALQTYFAKVGGTIDTEVTSPFTDIDDPYVTIAYNLGIVAGTGNNEFSPSNYITRQESAVMVRNLANILNMESNSNKSETFVDEEYFADWAKDAIYTVSSMHLGDNIYIMTGTGEGKFSPWYNYTREQAIATMLRMYKYI